MPEAQPATLLVVNDDPASLYVLSRILSRGGYRVREAATAAQALAMAREGVDLLVLDVRLPDGNGFEVCAQLKASPQTAAVMVLLVSAHLTRLENRVEGLEGGADGYLVQPVDPGELLATVRALLRLREAEEAARGAARAWQSTFDALSEGVCVLDATGRVERVNGALPRLLGVEGERLVGRPFTEVLRAHTHAEEGALTLLAQPAEHGRAQVACGPRWLEVKADPVRAADGRLTGAVRVLTDISAHKAHEQALRERATELALADQRKDEFLAMLGHELRNPLAAVASGLDLLERREELSGPARGPLGMVRRQARHLGRLVEDLLDVSRISHGRVELRRSRVDLREVASQSLEVCSTLHAARAQQVELHMPALPVWAEVDPTRLEQVLTNLLDNAMKYTGPGGSIRLRLLTREGRAVLSVEDSGMGIAPELLPTIFEPFIQAEQALARTDGGLGVGLSLVRHLVELHGGRVQAHSAGPQQGSTFSVELPLQAEASLCPTPAPQPAPSRSRRVLLVEDNPEVREALHELLELAGHQVTEVGDGLAAVEQAVALSPEVAVVDVGLPGLDGFEVARRIRASPVGDRLTLIALTGYGGAELKRRALEAGFDVHLVKPVEPEVLEQLLEQLPPPGARSRPD